MNKYVSFYRSKIGILKLVSDGVYLTNLKLVKEELDNSIDLPIFRETKEFLDDYFNKRIVKPNLKIKLIGTEFQKLVWNLLKEISYGKTITYKELTDIVITKMNVKKMSSQAVGGAISKNPLPIIIPCHRVIGSNKKLGGFSLGLDVKKKLLEIENIDTSDLKE